MKPGPIEKYLTTYAEPEARVPGALLESLAIASAGGIGHCTVMPVRDETVQCLQRFANSVNTAEKTSNDASRLIIVVVNQPQDRCSEINQHFWEEACGLGDILWKDETLTLLSIVSPARYLCLLVDRFSIHPIAADEGVGLARKIGCDLAVALYQQGHLHTPLLHSTDGDATVPAEYFSHTLAADDGVSAWVLGFNHVIDPSTTPENSECLEATRIYQQALRYYRDGLRYAASPYAFYTLGSTLVVSIHHYCLVRGFPKRAGGEDFYLLNKLAKVGRVNSCDRITIEIIARHSHRVPFGTGPAVEKIQSLRQADKEFCYYNAGIFACLRKLLLMRESFWHSIHRPEIALAQLDSTSNEALTAIGFERFMEHASRQCKTLKQFHKHFNDWFDGFRTLKFIHECQNRGYPPQPLTEACLQLERYGHP